MKSCLTCLSLALLAATACGPASAQFSLSALKPSGGTSAQGPDLSTQQTALVKQYVAADKEVLGANAFMAEALGLKDQAAAAKATGDALQEGATKGNLSDADKATSTSSDAIAATLKQSPQLDDQAKAKFAQGLKSLVSGTVHYAALRQPVQDFATGLKGAGLLQAAQLGTGAYLVKSFPDSAKNLGESLHNAVNFAKSNNIPVPADATQAMAAL